jgi:hypothetical protein
VTKEGDEVPQGSAQDSAQGSAQETVRPSSRSRNFWQLHVPLVVVLALCTVITVIEVRRASEGVWRAWAYMFEWPLIGLFTLWIWHRYRTEGSVTKGLVARWRERIALLGAEADDETSIDGPSTPPVVSTSVPMPRSATPPDTSEPDASLPAEASDPELQAWRDHVADLQRREPPGEPPVR